MHVATHVTEMLRTHPRFSSSPAEDVLTRVIVACYDCAQTCVSCADACLGEEEVRHLSQCIRLDLDCADLCCAAGAMASRRTGANPAVLRPVLAACEAACRACAEECERHAEMHEHCAICAEVCRECETACREALAAL